MSTVSAISPSLALGRYAKAMAAAKGDVVSALGFAEGQRWNWANSPSTLATLKTAVDAMSSTDPGGLTDARVGVGNLILPIIRANTIVDRMPNIRRVPLNVKVPAFTGDATASLVGEGVAKPLSKFDMTLLTVQPKKVSAAIVITDELLRLSDPTVETSLGNELAKAVAARSDLLFADPNIGGSIANGATTISSTGGSVTQIDSDLKLMLNALAGSGDTALVNAVWVMSSKTAIWLSTLRTTNGPLAYPTVTAKGGTLFGLPVLTTGAMVATGSPGESAILLVAQDQILFGDTGEAEITVARHASIVMDDAAANPATSTISLFQANRVALRAERYIGWARQSANSVIVLDNVSFAA